MVKVAGGQSIDLEDQSLESATAGTQRGSVARKRSKESLCFETAV